MSAGKDIPVIPVGREKKEKLIKWYGWIFILVVAFTPLIILLLPLLMVNTNKINNILKLSRINEELYVEGVVRKAKWESRKEYGLDLIAGELELETPDGAGALCTFYKYVGPNNIAIPEIHENHLVGLTGQKLPDGCIAIRNIQNFSIKRSYTTEPSVSVY